MTQFLHSNNCVRVKKIPTAEKFIISGVYLSGARRDLSHCSLEVATFGVIVRLKKAPYYLLLCPGVWFV